MQSRYKLVLICMLACFYHCLSSGNHSKTSVSVPVLLVFVCNGRKVITGTRNQVATIQSSKVHDKKAVHEQRKINKEIL